MSPTGHLLALERGRIGERYILGGQNVSLRRHAGDIAALAGRRPPTHRAAARRRCCRSPRRPRRWRGVTGKEPFLTRDALRMARKHDVLHLGARRSASSATRRGPAREALADALAWFRAGGMIR